MIAMTTAVVRFADDFFLVTSELESACSGAQYTFTASTAA
jgi:hypothetical protein